MRWIALAVSLLIPLVAAPAGAQQPQPKTAEVVPKIVAKVNGVEITGTALTEATQAAAVQLQMMGGQMPAGGVKTLQRGVLDDLIAMELLAQEAKTRKLNPSDKEVDARLTEFKAMFPSEDVYKQALASKGVSVQEVKDDLRAQLAISKLLEKEVEAKITIPEAEIKAFYNERKAEFRQPERAKASHILVKVDAGADAEVRKKAKAKAESLAARAKKGEDFAALAKEHSDDPGSGKKGGDLGEFKRSDMVKPFADAAFKLKPGEVSSVVETQFGYHVIKLSEVKKAATLPLKEVRKDITEFLKLRKTNDQAKIFVEKLRSKAKVQTFL